LILFDASFREQGVPSSLSLRQHCGTQKIYSHTPLFIAKMTNKAMLHLHYNNPNLIS